MRKGGYVYILTNKRNGSLYIGVTANLHRRMLEHKSFAIPGFASHNKLNQLVYFEEFPTIDEAIIREKQLKKWSRVWKVRLIENANSEWHDLAADWLN